MSELNRLDKLQQLELMDSLAALTQTQLDSPSGNLDAFNRSGKKYYRMRTDDWRIYFDLNAQTSILHAHYMLHKHTLADFIFRFKLPFKEETMLEQSDNFWNYLETLKK